MYPTLETRGGPLRRHDIYIHHPLSSSPLFIIQQNVYEEDFFLVSVRV